MEGIAALTLQFDEHAVKNCLYLKDVCILWVKISNSQLSTFHQCMDQ